MYAPEISMFCFKKISVHVSMKHVKSSSNLDDGYQQTVIETLV